MHFSLLSILGLLTACILPIITTAQNSSSNAEGTSPIFTNVAPVLTGDTDAITAITQGLSLYGIAIDTKNFTALSGAFTSDVVAVVAPAAPLSASQYTRPSWLPISRPTRRSISLPRSLHTTLEIVRRSQSATNKPSTSDQVTCWVRS